MTGINGADRVQLTKDARDRMDTLEMLIMHRLHLVTVSLPTSNMLKKLNYHSRELTELHGSLAYSLFYPWRSTTSRVDQWYMQRYASEFEGLGGEVHRFDAAREIHERLSEWLGARKTMNGSEIVEEEEKEGVLIEEM